MDRDPEGADGHRPKSWSRWLRCTLLINGITGPLPYEDAVACATMLVVLKRAVPPNVWVDELIEREEMAAQDNFGAWGG